MRSLRSITVAILMLGAFSLVAIPGCGGGAPQTPGTTPGSAPATEPGATTGTAPAGGAKPRLLLFTQPG